MDKNKNQIEIQNTQSSLLRNEIAFFIFGILSFVFNCPCLQDYLLQQIYYILLISFLTTILSFIMKIKDFLFKEQLKINFTVVTFGFIISFCLFKLFTNFSTPYRGFYVFLISNIIYHFGEFNFVAFCHIKLLSWDSFLINHSVEYGIAILFGICEYFLELHYFPNFKVLLLKLKYLRAHFCGFVLVQIFLVLAIILELEHFIMRKLKKKEAHKVINLILKHNFVKLVTSGVYSFCRHPSYFGFFLYSLGCQAFLANILTFIIHGIVLWKFFTQRIAIEEKTLVYFFQEEYIKYAKKVPQFLPLSLVPTILNKCK